MFVQGWLSLHTCICPNSSPQNTSAKNMQFLHNKEKGIENVKKYKDIIDFDTNENRICDQVVCKCGCRLRAIVRLTISGLGFTFLVSGIVVSMVGSSETGKL